MDSNYVDEFVIGRVGEDAGREFLAFLQKEVPPVEELLENPDRFKKLDLDSKYIFCVMAGVWLQRRAKDLGEKEVEKLARLLNAMMKDSAEYPIMVLLSSGNEKMRVISKIRSKTERVIRRSRRY